LTASPSPHPGGPTTNQGGAGGLAPPGWARVGWGAGPGGAGVGRGGGCWAARVG